MTEITSANDNTKWRIKGKYYGEPLVNIPASYLIWASENLTYLQLEFKMYIRTNMEVLKTQAALEKAQKKSERR